MLTLKLRTPAVFAFNVGEEGLGNLKGSRALTDAFGDRLSYFMAVDGNSDRFVNLAVGSGGTRSTWSRPGATAMRLRGGQRHQRSRGDHPGFLQPPGAQRSPDHLQCGDHPGRHHHQLHCCGSGIHRGHAVHIPFRTGKLDAAFQAILKDHTTDKVKVETCFWESGPAAKGCSTMKSMTGSPPSGNGKA